MVSQPPLQSQTTVDNKPSIVSWNRLEPNPRDWQFNRALRAEVRDPAWMLARQWQVGEFKSENRASPAFAQIEYELAKLTHYKPGPMADGKEPFAYNDSVPLEVQVERETVPIDLNRRLQMGQYWMRLFSASFSLFPNMYPVLIQVIKAQFSLEVPEDNLSGYNLDYGRESSIPQQWQMLKFAAGRTFDGYQLFETILNNNNWINEFVNNHFSGAEEGPEFIDAFNRRIYPKFLDWFNRLYSQPIQNQDAAWQKSSLEYKFKAVSSLSDNGSNRDQMLVAEDYSSGRLEWYSFDAEPEEVTNTLQYQYGGNDPVEKHKVTFFPTNMRFPGAPNARWWEFEDGKINVGKISIDTSDLGRMFFLDFMFLYNSDWFLFPVNMKTGSICKVKSLVITDVFGRKNVIRPAGEGDAGNALEQDWGDWSMFALSEHTMPNISERKIFLPPTVAKSMEGEPVEKVSFLRDEMANLVWGVEQIIPDGLGKGIDGSRVGLALQDYFKAKELSASIIPTLNNSDYIYNLATEVPENWIPFIPTQIVGGSREIQYQLGAMPRVVKRVDLSNSDSIVNPRGVLLQELDSDPNPFINEEEVPREGTIVTRSFQRTRWFNGKTFVWMGRQKKVGRGEGSSGLLFDQLLPVDPEHVGSHYDPDVVAFNNRVVNDGGSIVNLDYIDEIVKLLKEQNVYGNLKTWVSANGGIKKDNSGKINKAYSLKGAAQDLIQNNDGLKPLWQQDGSASIVFNGSNLLETTGNVDITGSNSRQMIIVAKQTRNDQQANLMGWGQGGYGTANDLILSNNLIVWHGHGSGMSSENSESPSYSVNEWFLAHVSFDELESKFRIGKNFNLNQEFLYENSPFNTSNSPLVVGAGKWVDKNNFAGGISEVMVFDIMLPELVLNLINAKLKIPSS